MFADMISQATHRFATNVRQGKGYFGDGFKYLKAGSDKDALDFATGTGAKVTLFNIQSRDPKSRKWKYCARASQMA